VTGAEGCATAGRRGRVAGVDDLFLPDPTPRDVRYTVISVDDHVVEPPHTFEGRRPETVKLEPFRFDQMRPGCYDVEARVRDMDVNGVWASVNFPSQITGFCGSVFSGVAAALYRHPLPATVLPR